MWTTLYLLLVIIMYLCVLKHMLEYIYFIEIKEEELKDIKHIYACVPLLLLFFYP